MGQAVTEIPKWLDDLIWLGKGVDPSKIDYPKDPPGVLGPHTIRGWQRMMAPHNAASKYTPVRIDFSPADYQLVRRRLNEVAVATSSVPLPPMAGFQITENPILPTGFATFHFADRRVELVKLVAEKKPEPKVCKCRGVICSCNNGLT